MAVCDGGNVGAFDDTMRSPSLCDEGFFVAAGIANEPVRFQPDPELLAFLPACDTIMVDAVVWRAKRASCAKRVVQTSLSGSGLVHHTGRPKKLRLFLRRSSLILGSNLDSVESQFQLGDPSILEVDMTNDPRQRPNKRLQFARLLDEVC